MGSEAAAVAPVPLIVIGCLVWLPVSIWVVAMVQWTIGGEVDVLTGLAGIGTALGLGVATMFPPIPGAQPFMLALVLLMIAVFPAAKTALDKHQLAMADIEQMERVYDLLGKDRVNIGAKLRLARALNTRGLRSIAIAVAEDVLQGLPRRFYEEDLRMLRQWKSDNTQPSGPIPCMECGHKNAPSVAFCQRCGSRFLVDYARGRWLGVNLARKLILIWAALVMPIAGMALTWRYLPPAFLPLSATLFVSLSFLVIWLAFRKPARVRT